LLKLLKSIDITQLPKQKSHVLLEFASSYIVDLLMKHRISTRNDRNYRTSKHCLWRHLSWTSFLEAHSFCLPASNPQQVDTLFFSSSFLGVIATNLSHRIINKGNYSATSEVWPMQQTYQHNWNCSLRKLPFNPLVVSFGIDCVILKWSDLHLQTHP